MAFDLEDLRIISRTTSALISSIGSRELFQTIVDGGRDITGAKFVSLSFFDEDEGTVELGALSGLEHPLLKRVSEILGVEDLLRYEFQVEGCASFEKFLGEKERRPYVLSGLHEFTFESLDGRACSLVEKIVGIEEVTVIPLLREGKLEGIMGYMFPSKEDRDFTPLLIFADLASQAIERSKMFRRMREEKERAKSYSEELRKSKERFRRLFEGSPDITLVINEEGIIEEINEVACRKTGLSEEEIVGRSYEDFSLLAESSRGRLVKNFERRMAGEEVPPYTMEFRDREGKVRHAEVNTSILEEDGEIQGEIVVARDITERRWAKEMYRKVFDGTHDAMWIVDVEDGNQFSYEDVNPEYSRNFAGLEREEVIGSKLEELFDPETVDMISEDYRRVVEEGEPLEREQHLELPVGSRWHLTTLTPLRDEEGKVDKIIGSGKDITERKRREAGRMKEAMALSTAETIAGVIIEEFDVRVSAASLGLQGLLEHLAELSTSPSPPQRVFDLMVTGIHNNLRDKGAEVDEEGIRQILVPHIRNFLKGVFVVAKEARIDIPPVYEEFERELAPK